MDGGHARLRSGGTESFEAWQLLVQILSLVYGHRSGGISNGRQYEHLARQSDGALPDCSCLLSWRSGLSAISSERLRGGRRAVPQRDRASAMDPGFFAPRCRRQRRLQKPDGKSGPGSASNNALRYLHSTLAAHLRKANLLKTGTFWSVMYSHWPKQGCQSDVNRLSLRHCHCPGHVAGCKRT